MMEWGYCRELVHCLLTCLADHVLSHPNPDAPVLEQCYCALGNVCASARGQDIILNNPDAMDLIKRGLKHGDSGVQSGAVFCVCNLAKTDDETLREDRVYLCK